MDISKEHIVPSCDLYPDLAADWTLQRRYMATNVIFTERYMAIANQHVHMCEGKGMRIVDLSKTTAREHNLMFQKLKDTAATHLTPHEMEYPGRVMEELATGYSYGFSIRRNTKIPLKLICKADVSFYAHLAALLYDVFYHLTHAEYSGTCTGTSIYLTPTGLIPYVVDLP